MKFKKSSLHVFYEKYFSVQVGIEDENPNLMATPSNIFNFLFFNLYLDGGNNHLFGFTHLILS